MEERWTRFSWRHRGQQQSLQSDTALPPHILGVKKGEFPLHGHTALEGRELGVILINPGAHLSFPYEHRTSQPLQSQQSLLNSLWGFKGLGRRSPGFLEWECQS